MSESLPQDVAASGCKGVSKTRQKQLEDRICKITNSNKSSNKKGNEGIEVVIDILTEFGITEMTKVVTFDIDAGEQKKSTRVDLVGRDVQRNALAIEGKSETSPTFPTTIRKAIPSLLLRA